MVHRSGYVYNNLCFEEILFDSSVTLQSLKKASPETISSLNLNLVDFTYTQRYIDFKSGSHLPWLKNRSNRQRSEYLFASNNQLQRFQTSRKDDLINLSYILIYLLNDF